MATRTSQLRKELQYGESLHPPASISASIVSVSTSDGVVTCNTVSTAKVITKQIVTEENKGRDATTDTIRSPRILASTPEAIATNAYQAESTNTKEMPLNIADSGLATGESISSGDGVQGESVESYKVSHFTSLVSVVNVKNIVLSAEEKRHYQNIRTEQVVYGQSIAEQNEKTESYYLGFVRALDTDTDPYPVSEDLGVAFIQYLADTHQFCYNTLSTVMYESLLRLNKIRSGVDMHPTVRSAILTRLRQIRISPTTKRPRGGKEPLILDDLKRIIMHIPEVDPAKARLSSLFLFSLFTGARANSCRGVRFCDFTNFRDMGEGCFTLGVNIRQVKGKQGQGILLTVGGGNPEIPNDVNILYWLNRVYTKFIGMSLECYSKLTKEEQMKYTDPVWPWSEDGMTQHLKYRMRMAGLPGKEFSFHSLRAGFLASILLHARNTTEGLDGVLSAAAIIAGWTPYSEVELRYIKETTRAAIVTTDLLGVTSTPKKRRPAAVEGDVAHPESHLSSFDFHHWEEIDPPEDKHSYAPLVKAELLQHICEYKSIRRMKYEIGQQLWNSASWRFGREILEEKGEEWKESETKSGTKRWNYAGAVGKKEMNVRIRQNPECVSELASKLFDYLVKDGVLNREIPEEEEPPPKPGGPRIRRAFTEEEDRIIQAGMKKNLSVSEIRQQLQNRLLSSVKSRMVCLQRRMEQTTTAAQPQPPPQPSADETSHHSSPTPQSTTPTLSPPSAILPPQVSGLDVLSLLKQGQQVLFEPVGIDGGFTIRVLPTSHHSRRKKRKRRTRSPSRSLSPTRIAELKDKKG